MRYEIALGREWRERVESESLGDLPGTALADRQGQGDADHIRGKGDRSADRDRRLLRVERRPVGARQQAAVGSRSRWQGKGLRRPSERIEAGDPGTIWRQVHLDRERRRDPGPG